MGKLGSFVHRHSRLTRYLLVGAGLLLVTAILIGVKGAQIASLMAMGKEMERSGLPPETVAAATAKPADWETTLSAVGTISGLRSVAVSSEVPGTVTRIRFQSGEVARQGEILVELDTSVERAQVASAKARRDLATKTAARSRMLAGSGAISKAQLDEAESALESAGTDLAALSAQLDRKLLRAPFEGRLGIRAVNVGQYLTPGTAVTTLDALGGTFVDFSLPQEQLDSVSVGMPVRVTMEGSSAEPLQGAITAIESTVDATTRNARVRASIVDQGARPGTFVNVAVVSPKRQSVVVVPATAIVHAPYGDSVFVIEPKKQGSPGAATSPDGKPIKVARQQFVRVGPARGDFVAVTKGVTAGQEVVSAGAFKLRNGAPIVVDNKVQTRPQLDPRPENR